MFRFIHCADLHLDSPLRGLATKQDAPQEQIRQATRRALENLVQLALMEQVDFIVIAGDVYDGDWDDYSTGLFFNKQMMRLQEANIPVYLIRGNHDAATNITKQLTLPPHVHEFSVREPETMKIEHLKVALHGQGFAERSVQTDLSLHYPDSIPNYFNIGILHTCAEGQEGHESYAPCRVSDLARKGYQYWALGHIHKPQILHENPYIVFPGNLQGRHIKETGARGCVLVSVSEQGVALDSRSLDVLRWYECSVDISSAEDDTTFASAVYDTLIGIADQNPDISLAVRIRIVGETELHGVLWADVEHYYSEVKNAAIQAAGDRIWIEKVLFETSAPASSQGSVYDTDVVSSLLNLFDDASAEENFLVDFAEQMKQLQLRLRAYAQSDGALLIQSPQDIERIVPDAKHLLRTLLSKDGVRL